MKQTRETERNYLNNTQKEEKKRVKKTTRRPRIDHIQLNEKHKIKKEQ